MKNKIVVLVIFSSLLIEMVGCSYNKNEKKNADSSVRKERSKLKINSVYRVKRDRTYVDLNTGKKISLMEDSLNKTIVDAHTGFPVPFFIDIDTNDTIDEHGRIVNNALLPGENGLWKLDEGRLKKIK